MIILFAPTEEHAMLFSALRELQWGNIISYIWYKPNFNQVGTHRSLNACEHMVMAWRGTPAHFFRGHSQKPVDRHNFIKCDAVVSKYMYDTKVLHVAEKPVALMEKLFSVFQVAGVPVLSLGFGSGTDLLAAMALGIDLVGVEVDIDQFRGAQARIMSWMEEQARSAATKAAEQPAAPHASSGAAAVGAENVAKPAGAEAKGPGEPVVCFKCKKVDYPEMIGPCQKCAVMVHLDDFEGRSCVWTCGQDCVEKGVHSEDPVCSIECHMELVANYSVSLERQAVEAVQV